MFLILWDLMMPSRCKLNVKRQADLLAWKKRYGCADVWKTRWQSHEWDMTWYDSPWLKHGYVFFADNFDNFMFQVFDTCGHPYDDKLSS